MVAGPVVGVLALQGAFARHLEMLTGIGVKAREVRTPAHLDAVDALIIPGGESTTISKLLDLQGLRSVLQERLDGGMAAFGTCAGMILLASEVLDGRADQDSFASIDISVRRNGYGRQLDSFEDDNEVSGMDGGPFRTVFIRAPVVERVGADVEVVATVDDRPILVASGPVLASSFHPELTNDDRLHRRFVEGL